MRFCSTDADESTEMPGRVGPNGDRAVARGAAEGFRLGVGGGPSAAARARNELARLTGDLGEASVETLRLLVTELVANAVRHAAAPAVELVVAINEETVRVEVANPGRPFEVHVGTAGREEGSNWGLFLVDRLSDGWGVLAETGYQRVWFEISRC